MSKYRKPIRGVYNELFDVDWSWQKRERVQDAYVDFWATLSEELVETLNFMLM